MSKSSEPNQEKNRKLFESIYGDKESFLDVLGEPKISDLKEFRSYKTSLSNAGSSCDTDWINEELTEYRMILFLRIPRKENISKEDHMTTIWNGEYDLYVEVIYKCKELPKGFSEEEKKMFQKITLKLPYSKNKKLLKDVDVFQFIGGRDISNCEWSQERRRIRVAPEISKLYYYNADQSNEKKKKFKGNLFHNLSDCVDYLDGKKFIFLAGAGASSELLTYGTQSESALGQLRTPDLIKKGGIDRMVKNMMNKNGRRDILDGMNRSLFFPILEEKKTSIHSEIAEIAFHFKTQILTTNFDFLFELSGIQPLKILTNRQIENLIRMKDYEKIDVIICIGIGADRKNVMSYFRKMNPNGVIISFDFDEVTYLEEKDFLVKGDFIKNGIIRKFKEMMIKKY